MWQVTDLSFAGLARVFGGCGQNSVINLTIHSFMLLFCLVRRRLQRSSPTTLCVRIQATFRRNNCPFPQSH